MSQLKIVVGDNGIDSIDLARVREQLVGASLGGPFDLERCDVNDDGSCGVTDAFLIDRVVGGASAIIIDACPGYFGP